MEKTSKLVVLGIIENQNGEILISQRFEEELPEVHLKWDLPGGKNEFGESLEETIVREVLEETGLNVKIKNLLPKTISKVWEYSNRKQHTLLFCFHCSVIDGEMHLNDRKIHNLKWVSRKMLDDYIFLPTRREFIDMVLK